MRMRREKRRTGRALFVVCLLLVALGAGGFYLGYLDGLLRRVERQAPELNLEPLPAMAGGEKLTLKFSVIDRSAGLQLVALHVAAVGDSAAAQELFRREYEFKAKVQSEAQSVEFDPSGLAEGEVEFTLLARDQSWFTNQQTVRARVKIDRSRPRVEILSRQHNLREGGTGLVLFKAEDNNELVSAVRINDRSFPAFPASAFDQAFAAQPAVQFAFFALPVESRGRAQKIEVLARDAAGNTTVVDLPFRLKRYKQRHEQLKLSDSFVERKVAPLEEEFRGLKSDLPPSADNVARFRLVNETYREYLAAELEKVLSQPLAQRGLEGVFLRLPNAAQKSSFAELRSYELNGQAAGGSLHEGVDLASLAQAEVPAAQNGVVIFARNLGIYGNTVIVDHGFGLTSLYGHLSSIAVQEGTPVKTGQILGQSGATGLAGGDHLHFEIRVHNVSVTPIEWWDPLWLKNHVFDRFELGKSMH